MDVMLLQEFRGLEQVPREQVLRFLRARLRFDGFETICEENGSFLLMKTGNREPSKTIFAFEVTVADSTNREAENAVCAALLRIMDEVVSWNNLTGEVQILLTPAGKIPKELCAVRLELDPALAFGSVSVSANSLQDTLAADCVQAAGLISLPETQNTSGQSICIRIGYANSGSPYRIHPLAMERAGDVLRELLRLRHS